MFDSIKRVDFIYRFTEMYRQEQRVLKTLHDFTKSVIVSRKQELAAADMKSAVDENDMGIKKKTAFLDLLLQSTVEGQPLSNEDIREEVDTFMFEVTQFEVVSYDLTLYLQGHDTTTSGIAFVFYNLAMYPQIQQKVFEELRSTFGDDLSAPVAMQELNSLSYLELVIKETLRLYPSVPFFGRKATEDLVFENVTIPQNTSINIAPFYLGRDPKIFPDPLRFDPLRFDVETNNEKNNPFAYVPFSAGPRNCIGKLNK